MDRRSLLSLVAGVAIGWTGATLVDDDSSPDDSDTGGTDDSRDGAGSPSPTDVPPETETPTPTPEPAETTTATAEPTATPEPTPTETATPESNGELQRNLAVSSRGFANDGVYEVIYSIRNENDVTVSVTFEATVTLQNNTRLRQERTATIEPGQAASDEFVFDEYDSSPSGYGFKPLRTVEA